MTRDRTDTHSSVDVADTLGAWGVGAGMITMALFPLAIPFIVLTAVAVLPLLVPVLAVGVVVGLVALPVVVVRSVVRAVARRRPSVTRPEAVGRAH